MALSGPLPAHIFETHPHLTTVNLEMNNFTGTLPVAWAASQVGSSHSLLAQPPGITQRAAACAAFSTPHPM